MVKRVILGRSGEEKIVDLIRAINDKASVGHTRPAGTKVLDDDEDFIWSRPDGTTHSVRDIDAELEGAKGRIEDAEQSLADSQVRLDEAEQTIASTTEDLTRVETVVIPGAVERLEQADQEAQDTFAELDQRLAGFASDEALAPIRDALATAQSAVETAQQVASEANTAANAASQAALEAAGIAASKGRVIVSETEPVGEDRKASNIWIKPVPDDPETEVEERAVTYVFIEASNEWQPTTSSELAQAAQNALDAREAAQQAQQRAETAISNASKAQGAAEAAQRTADDATLDARDAHNAAVDAQSRADAAMSSALSANMVVNAGFEGRYGNNLIPNWGWSGVAYEIETANVHGGKQALRLPARPAGAYAVATADWVPLAPNRYYKAGGWVYLSEDIAGVLDGSQLTHMLQREDGSYIWGINYRATLGTLPTGVWRYVETAPFLNSDGFVRARPNPQSAHTAGHVLWDDLFFADVTDAVLAQQVADTAQARAEEAYGKAESAETAAGGAVQKAEAAESAASQAAQDAQSAYDAAAAAEASSEAATGAAGLAEQAADKAAADALAALGQAQNAGGNASAAQAAADEAERLAIEAERQAGLAGTSASQADAAAARSAADAAQAAADAVAARADADAARTDADSARVAAEDAQDRAEEAFERATAPTANMIHNGSGHFGMENFTSSGWRRYPEDAPAGASASYGIEYPGTAWLAKRISVNPARKYRMAAHFRQATEPYDVASRFYMALVPYDSDGLTIGTAQYARHASTLTKLAQPLNPGDTTVTLESASGWSLTNYQTLAVYDYVDGSGKHWGTDYSRIAQPFDAINGNVLTLRTPWAGKAHAAGVEVAQGLHGGSYMYPLNRIEVMPHEWTPRESNVIGGVHDIPTAVATTAFPAPTASVQPGFLLNYTGQTESRHRVANIGFFDITEALAAQDAAEAAQERADEAMAEAERKLDESEVQVLITASANGKNSITRATRAPSTSTADRGVVEGDAWYYVDGDGDSVGMWIWNGSAWVASKVRNEMIDTLDVNKLKVHNDLEVIGDAVIDKLWADGIAAKSATFNSLTVASGNIYFDPSWRVTGIPQSYLTEGAGHSGGRAVVRYGLNAGVYEYIGGRHALTPVTPGTTYRVGAWIKSNVAVEGSGRINYGWMNRAKEIIGGAMVGERSGEHVPDEWQWVEFETTAPEGAAYIYLGFYNNNTSTVFTGTVTYSDPSIIPLVGAVTIKDGAITTPKLTVTGDMSAAIVNAMTTNTKKLIVTEDAVLNHVTAIGQTVVDDINVQGKLVGTGGVFTGTVDFANINVTGEVLAGKISGEHLYGTTVEGGEIITANAGSGQVILSDDGFVDPSNQSASPGIKIIPPDTSELVTPPGMGPNSNGFIITGGRNTAGGRAFSIYSPSSAAMSFARGTARANVATQDGLAWVDATDTNGNFGQVVASPSHARVQSQAPDGSAGIIRANSSYAYVATLAPGGSTMSQIRSNGREAFLWSYGSDGLGRILSVDSNGVWVKMERESSPGSWDHYNLNPQRNSSPFSMPSGWQADGSANNAKYTITLGMCYWGGILKYNGTLPAGWTTLGYAPVAARPREGDQTRALPTSSGRTVLGKIHMNGLIQIWVDQAASGIFMHFAPFTYLV